jgi:hypothetical protein
MMSTFFLWLFRLMFRVLAVLWQCTLMSAPLLGMQRGESLIRAQMV